MVEFWANWVRQYPIISIEDGMAEDDWEGWKLLTDALGANKIQLVGDDLFVTNTARLTEGHRDGRREFDSDQGEPDRHADAKRWKPCRLASRNATTPPMVSHRSGETEDPFIADLAVATNAGQIKTGSASRTDRIAKYNQLLRIEEGLGDGREVPGPEGVPSIGMARNVNL